MASPAVTPTSRPRSSVGRILLWIVFLGFWMPDIFAFPFRALSAGPGGVYGTWVGAVRTEPEHAAADARSSNQFAVVKLHLRPPFFATLPHFFWRPSHEIAGSLDVYLPDGSHQHCVEQMGGIFDGGKLQLLVYDPGHNVDAPNEADVTAGTLNVTLGMCPLPDARSVSFTGPLSRGSSADVDRLLPTLPALSAALGRADSAGDAALAGEWVGEVSVWDPASQPTRPPPDAAMRLILTPAGATGSFTGQGEIRHAWGWTETMTLPHITLRADDFEATGVFKEVSDEPGLYNGGGGLAGTLTQDTLTITQGGMMLLGVAGTLHHGTDADFQQIIAALPHLKPGQYP